MNKLKLLQFRCKFATDQQPFHYNTIAISVAILLQQICSHYDSLQNMSLQFYCNSVANSQQHCNESFLSKPYLVAKNLCCKIHYDCFFFFFQFSLIFVKFVNFQNSRYQLKFSVSFKIPCTNFKISCTIIKKCNKFFFLIANNL